MCSRHCPEVEPMSDTLLISTRKGLFTVARRSGRWAIAGLDFLGDNVTLALADARDGNRYAALDHGHFGVKLYRAEKGGGWEEIAAPAYPPKPEGYEEKGLWDHPKRKQWMPGGADLPGIHSICIDPRDSRRVTVGVSTGGVWASEDGG